MKHPSDRVRAGPMLGRTGVNRYIHPSITHLRLTDIRLLSIGLGFELYRWDLVDKAMGLARTQFLGSGPEGADDLCFHT